MYPHKTIHTSSSLIPLKGCGIEEPEVGVPSTCGDVPCVEGET